MHRQHIKYAEHYLDLNKIQSSYYVKHFCPQRSNLMLRIWHCLGCILQNISVVDQKWL